MREFWQDKNGLRYEGEPTDEEIAARKAYDKENYDHLAIRHICPNCGSKNTMWVRNQWSICFGCESSFTLAEALACCRGEDCEFWEQF